MKSSRQKQNLFAGFCTTIAVAIACVLLLSAVSRSDEKHQNQADAHNRSANRKPEPAAPAFTIIVQPAPVKIIQQAAPIEQNQSAEKWYQRPTVTDWGILVVTLLYTGISLGLLNATRIQANLAKRALIEATKAADAANDSAKFARESFEAAQRASISIENVEVYPIGTGSPSIQYELRNTGSVPATGVVESCVVAKGDGKRPDPRYVQKGRIGAGDTSLIDDVIAPGEVIKRFYDFSSSNYPDIPPPVTNEDMIAANEGRRYIMCSVQIAYWDGFGKERMSAKYFLITEGNRVEPYGGKHE